MRTKGGPLNLVLRKFVNRMDCTETNVMEVPDGWYVVHRTFDQSPRAVGRLATSVSATFVPDREYRMEPRDFKQPGEEKVS